jgi:hypothetical protein
MKLLMLPLIYPPPPKFMQFDGVGGVGADDLLSCRCATTWINAVKELVADVIHVFHRKRNQISIAG